MADHAGPHAFISYVREDSSAVDEVERVLAAAGIPVWRDLRNLLPGDVWKARIKEAIQGNALAFIPVFSRTSEARLKSQMREEIRLAIDEYRKIAPDQPWIFPLRLDDVDVPRYEISANQDLTDLNWTNFFGPTKTLDTTQLVARIQTLLNQARTQLATPSEVASSASTATRGTLLTSTFRSGLVDASKAADAHQMLIEETRRVIDTLNDEDRFPLGSPEGSITTARLDRTRELIDLIGPLTVACAELGARGKASDGALAAQIVSSLAREGFAPRSGLDVLTALRKLPALCVLVAGALGATARKNASMLSAFVAAPEIVQHQQSMLVPNVLSPWDPFGPEWEFPQFLAATLGGATVTDEVLDAYDNRRVRRTGTPSASVALRHILRPSGDGYTIGTPEYHDLFRRTEVLIGAIATDWSLQRQVRGWGLENWVGGPVDTERYVTDAVPASMLAELESAGSAWWPLEAPLFGGDQNRARKALSDFVEIVTEVESKRRW